MILKGLHFDELRISKKSNFLHLFRNRTTAQKPVYMQMGFILNKKDMCLLHGSSIFKKKSILKHLDRTVEMNN